MSNDAERNTIFRTELSLELHLGAGGKRSTLSIRSTEDVVTVVDGIKALAADNLIVIYLDEHDVIVGVESFLGSLDRFDLAQSTRAMSAVLSADQREGMRQVVVAQLLPQRGSVEAAHIEMRQLATFAYKLSLFSIRLRDCILIGRDGYFSFREDSTAWAAFEKRLKLLHDVTDPVLDIDAVLRELEKKGVR